ncbi:hypothetical protein A1Q2_00778 [Trichosporon asahii var. asahii CBS 8904]|uniref:Uncharacterized protein n=1 Tax=Trichosporon asahii var. asahii (strain CBS 8904) TaxID=1220162 RepID=K1VZB6_TRIAC|nr:hypothetical protein A1Q2_00778 [Trichosporon asahii var. asahii CBS 8904]
MSRSDEARDGLQAGSLYSGSGPGGVDQAVRTRFLHEPQPPAARFAEAHLQHEAPFTLSTQQRRTDNNGPLVSYYPRNSKRSSASAPGLLHSAGF